MNGSGRRHTRWGYLRLSRRAWDENRPQGTRFTDREILIDLAIHAELEGPDRGWVVGAIGRLARDYRGARSQLRKKLQTWLERGWIEPAQIEQVRRTCERFRRVVSALFASCEEDAA